MNPILKNFLIAVAVIWAVIMVVLVFLFLKYRSLKTRYSKLSEEGGNSTQGNMSGAGEIELQEI